MADSALGCTFVRLITVARNREAPPEASLSHRCAAFPEREHATRNDQPP
jgi:hypothetical protein